MVNIIEGALKFQHNNDSEIAFWKPSLVQLSWRQFFSLSVVSVRFLCGHLT